MSIKHLILAVLFALAAGCSQNGKPFSHKEAAKQQWNEARATVLCGLAKQQFEAGNLDDCKKALDEALTFNAKSAPVRVMRARLFIEQGRLELAEKELKEAAVIDPKNADVDYLSGVISQRWMKLPEALACYTRAMEKQPQELAYVLARAEMLVALGQPAQALELLQDRMVYFDNNPAIRDAVGQLLVQQGKYAEAVTVLRQASILGPEELAIREHLALAMIYAGQFRDAGIVLERLLKDTRYSARADLAMALGECQMQTGRPREARESFETASQLDPSSLGAWLNLTKAALEIGDLRRADLSARKAMSLDPASSEANLLLGYVRLRQDRLDDALTAFRKASALDDQETVSLCMSGYVLEKQGKHNEALACYGKALKIKPNDDLARSLMAAVE